MAKKRKPPDRLPGMEGLTIAEIDEAACDYVTIRDARMQYTKQEVEASKKLLEAMKKHELTSYEYDGRTVQVTSKSKVSVRSNGEHTDDEE